MTTKYSKKTILSINIHGGIELDENKDISTFQVPKNIKITVVQAVPFGIVNLVSDFEYNNYMDVIIKYQHEIAQTKNLHYTLEEIVQHFKKIDTISGEITKIKYSNNFIDNFISNENTDNSEKEMVKNQLKGYFHHNNKKYSVKTHKSSETITNKTFGICNSEKFKNNNNNWGWSNEISVVNKAGIPDLLDEMNFELKQKKRINTRKSIDEYYMADFKDITRFLGEKGVKELVVFDFSCSEIFHDGDYYKEDAYIRNIRRNESIKMP
jgi:hypothetical protein